MLRKKLLKSLDVEQLEKYNKFCAFCSALFLLMVSTAASGSHYFEVDSTLHQVYLKNQELKLEEARQILARQQVADPDNSAVYYLLHFNTFVRAFITEEQEALSHYKQVQTKALAHVETLPDSIPFKRFVQADLYFYSALVKAKNNELYSAAGDVNKAYRAIEENHQLFPNFLPNNKTRGILKVYLATIPDNYKWVTRAFGMKGNKREGFRLLESLAMHHSKASTLGLIAKEAAYMRSFALLQVGKQPQKAWVETLRCTEDYKTSLISAFLRSNIALKLNKNETARKVLAARPQGLEYQSFYFLNYLYGVALLNDFDTRAKNEFQKFIDNYKGRNYIKSCWQKMSWDAVIHGRYERAEFCRKQILKGSKAILEEDKQAEHSATKPLPHAKLLKTRLLYDAGKYIEAEKVITTINVQSLQSRSLKAEYAYRRGRIAEKKGNMTAATKFYEACSLFAIYSTEYYGAYACIYLADYYLSIHDLDKAEIFYEKALTFKRNKEYVESINQRVKEGLKSVKAVR